MCHINKERGHFPTRPTDGFTDWYAEGLIYWFSHKRKTHFSPLGRDRRWGGVPFSGSHDVIRIGSNDLSIITTIMKRAALKTTLSSQCCPLMPAAITQLAWPMLLPDLVPNHSRGSAGRQQSFVWKSREREMSVWGSEHSALPNWQSWPLYFYQGVVKEARVQIYFSRLIMRTHCQIFLPPLMSPYACWPFGRRSPSWQKVGQKRKRGGKMWGKSVVRAEQEEWGSHGQGLINEPLI